MIFIRNCKRKYVFDRELWITDKGWKMASSLVFRWCFFSCFKKIHHIPKKKIKNSLHNKSRRKPASWNMHARVIIYLHLQPHPHAFFFAAGFFAAGFFVTAFFLTTIVEGKGIKQLPLPVCFSPSVARVYSSFPLVFSHVFFQKKKESDTLSWYCSFFGSVSCHEKYFLIFAYLSLEHQGWSEYESRQCHYLRFRVSIFLCALSVFISRPFFSLSAWNKIYS